MTYGSDGGNVRMERLEAKLMGQRELRRLKLKKFSGHRRSEMCGGEGDRTRAVGQEEEERGSKEMKISGTTGCKDTTD